jgi:DMATS type aromatic prenyltransferase
MDLLMDLLGANGQRPLSEPPAWPSNVADDHTQVEFSVAFNGAEPPSLRILGEALGSPPGARANMAAGYQFIDSQAAKFGWSTSRLNAVRDLFATEQPQGVFAVWCSLVFRSGRPPELKVYLNPEVKGAGQAPGLVGEALRRLKMGKSYQTLLDRVIRPGELGFSDRLSFFAIDLHEGPQARVKIYVTHHHAEVRDVIRAASAVNGVDAMEAAEFCTMAGGTSRFHGRPLVGSYTLTEGADEPVGYSIYVPARSYVSDDQEARDRAVTVLDRYGFDGRTLDRALAKVTQRPLRDGVGLIPHISLRLGPPRPGVTVYLSAEAYHVKPPRPSHIPAARKPAERPSSRTTAVIR